MRRLASLRFLATLLWGLAVLPAGAAGLQACRIEGMPNELLCGSVQRPLDPAHPQGVQIDIHFLVVPAMARNKQADAVLLLAGGPGQSAIAVAPALLGRLGRLNNRRDLVFIDQRGTGRSAPLQCPDERQLPLREAFDQAAQLRRLEACRLQLMRLPYGDLRFFTTRIAMQDFEAVRQALGVPQWDLIGASYGTRAALEYVRQFPSRVRRTVLDGVAPPDQILPASMSSDTQAALDAMFQACVAEPACAQHYPKLRSEWAGLFKALPRTIQVAHPLTGVPESLTLTRETVLRAVRAPLYTPTSAAALPQAIHSAAQGRFEGLFGLSGVMGNSRANRLAMGMHFSVICAEDLPRLDAARDAVGTDYGAMDADLYRRACADWPRGTVPADFYTVAPARSPVLLLSGGLDPVTPPRHADRVAAQLGPQVQHIVVPNFGHGVMGLACIRDVVFKFIDAANDAQALPQDAACAVRAPRPGAFLPVESDPHAGEAPA